MKLQARNFVVRKPETIDITMFFKKFCIATRTSKKRHPKGCLFLLLAVIPKCRGARSRAPLHVFYPFRICPWMRRVTVSASQPTEGNRSMAAP